MRNNHLGRVVPVAASLALLIGASGPAEALVLASSVFQSQGVKLINDQDDATPDDDPIVIAELTTGGDPDAQIRITGGGNNGDVSASLSSVAGSDEADFVGGAVPFNLRQVSQGTLPAALVPAGANPPGDNYTVITNDEDPTAGKTQVGAGDDSFALADQQLDGAIVRISEAGIGDDGAVANIRSDVLLEQSPGTESGTSTANNQTGTSITVIVGPTDLRVRYDAELALDLEAYVTDPSIATSTATAGASFVFDITDANDDSILGGGWTPFITQSPNSNSGDPGKRTRCLTATGISSDDTVCPEGFVAVRSPVATLSADETYTISIRQEVTADATATATAVPAPGTLALLGCGLGLVGAMSRRRRDKKASTQRA